MKKRLFCLATILLISSVFAPVVIAGPTHRIHNSDMPQSHQVLHPREIWRSGGEKEDLLFGFIITAEIDSEGYFYLLDRWLGAIHVLGPDGQFVRQLSRQGEGPGETNQPTALTWLPGGELGITQPLPGQLQRIDQAGNPLGKIVPAMVSAQEAQFGILTKAAWRGGTLACCGSQTNFKQGQLEVSRFLSVCDIQTGTEIARILEKKTSDDGHSTKHDSDLYWVAEGRWCLGPQGKVYTAPQRDTYAIHVHGANGHLEQIIERDYQPWHRTKEEMAALKERNTPPTNEWGSGRKVQISENDPCIDNLRVTGNGELWVRHSRSDRNQPQGVFATWDVFAPEGTYSRTVSVEINGNPDNDEVLFLGDNRLLLIRGFHEASDAMWGQAETEGEDILGEIVCFEFAP